MQEKAANRVNPEKPNSEPAYLRPLMELVIHNPMMLLELTAPCPTLFITEIQCQQLIDMGFKTNDQMWKLLVNGIHRDAVQARETLSERMVTDLTGTDSVEKLAKDHEYRIVVMSNGLPPATGLRRFVEGNDPEMMRPHIRYRNMSGNRVFIGSKELYGMVHTIKADLYKLHSESQNQKWLAKRYADYGYREAEIDKFFDDNVAKGWLEPPIYKSGETVKNDFDKYRTVVLQAAFQLLFGENEQTGEPIDKAMAKTINRIKAGELRNLKNEKLISLLRKRAMNPDDYMIDLSISANPERPYITEAQLRAFLIEHGVVDPHDNMNEVAAEIQGMLSTMNCVLPHQPKPGKAHMYISLTPGNSTILSADGSRKLPDSTRPLISEYCSVDPACPLQRVCTRQEDHATRYILPDEEEMYTSLPEMQDFLEYIVEKFNEQPFQSILVLPKSAIKMQLDIPLAEFRTVPTKRKGLLGKSKDNPNLPNPFGFRLQDETRGHPQLTMAGARLIDPRSIGRKQHFLKQLLTNENAEAYIDPRAPGKVMVYYPQTGAYEEVSVR